MPAVRLDARDGEWHPDADAGPSVVVRAFAVEGGPLQIPGPADAIHSTFAHGFAHSTNTTTGAEKLSVAPCHPAISDPFALAPVWSIGKFWMSGAFGDVE